MTLPQDSPTPPRKLGFWMCTALVVGNTIGMGIFVLPASLAPYGYNATIGWIVTVAGCLVLAQVFARLARTLPGADGPYGYLRATLGEVPAFLAMWCYWFSMWITTAILAIGVLGYLAQVVPVVAALPPVAMALALLWTFVGINLLGLRTGGGVQVATTLLKLVPMLAIAALGAWLLLAAPESYSRHPPTTPVAFGSIVAASTIALFAMLGFESATVPAARVHDPERTVPRATIAGTLAVAVVYLVVSTVPMLLLPAAELAVNPAPFATVMERYAATGSGRWLALFVVVSGLGALNGWTLLAGELTRTLATHGTMPAVLARGNARGAPMAGLLVTGALASAMIVMNYAGSLVDIFTFLSMVVTAANLPVYIGGALALLVLRARRPGTVSPGMAALAVIGVAYVLFSFVGIGAEPLLWAVVLALAGLVALVLMRRRPRATHEAPGAP